MYRRYSELCLGSEKAHPNAAANGNNDTETIVEQSAIMEHDGGNPRDQANMKAAQRHDHRRQIYQGSREDAEQVAACYRAIVTGWQPCEYADLPPVPPNLRAWPELQVKLWRLFWNAVESSNGA